MVPNTSGVPELTRRRTIKTLGTGVGLGTLSGVVGASEGTSKETFDLLPADKADFAEPTIKKTNIGDDTSVSTPIHEARVNDRGLASVVVRGVTLGKGELSMGGTAWLDSMWEAPSTGEYKIEAEYEHGTANRDQIRESAGVTITNEPSIAVENVRTGKIRGWDPKIGSNLVSAEITEQVIEYLLTRITSYLILPNAGFIAKRLVNYILGDVFEHLIEIRPRGTSDRWLNSGSTSFWAEEDEKYRIRFSVNNNFSGRSKDGDSGFSAQSSAFYRLNRFQISEVSED